MFRIILFFLFHIFLSISYAESWSQFRGPTGQGHVVRDIQLPINWDRKKGIDWNIRIDGQAWSSPICVNDQILLTNAILKNGDLKLEVISINFIDGKIRWRKNLFNYSNQPRIHKKNSYASPTPFYDGERIFIHYGNLGTACLELNGDIVWKAKLDYEPVHGSGASPVVFQNLLLLSADGAEDPSLYALNKKTGEIKWNAIRHSEAKKKFSFCTPIVVDKKTGVQIISPASDYVFAYDLSGNQIWKFNYPEGYSVVPRPVLNNDIVYVSSGFNSPTLYAFRVGGKGDITKSNLVWKTRKSVPRNSSMVIVDNLLFMASDNGVVSCLDSESGELYWIERVARECSASLLHGNGKIFLSDELGKTYIFKAERKYSLIATNDLAERVLASPVAYRGSLILRTEKGLWKIK